MGQGPEDSNDWQKPVDKRTDSNMLCLLCKVKIIAFHCSNQGCRYCNACSEKSKAAQK